MLVILRLPFLIFYSSHSNFFSWEISSPPTIPNSIYILMSVHWCSKPGSLSWEHVHTINCILYITNPMSHKFLRYQRSRTKFPLSSFHLQGFSISSLVKYTIIYSPPTLHLGVTWDSHIILTPLKPFTVIKSAGDQMVLRLWGRAVVMASHCSWIKDRTLSKIYIPSWSDPISSGFFLTLSLYVPQPFWPSLLV